MRLFLFSSRRRFFVKLTLKTTLDQLTSTPRRCLTSGAIREQCWSNPSWTKYGETNSEFSKIYRTQNFLFHRLAYSPFVREFHSSPDSSGVRDSEESLTKQKLAKAHLIDKGNDLLLSSDLPNAYDPTFVEAEWYNWWKQKGYFEPEYHNNISKRNCDNGFVIGLPPPNVTGHLHLGHALTIAVQDALVRWNRMNRIKTLWIPGYDHAGIATQVIVEKQLWKDKRISKFDLGREKFVQEVLNWKNDKGNHIREQIQMLGASLDWKRESFTMDENYSRAVCEAFIQLHNKGLIYRSTRLVNWSSQLKSAISDIEVDDLSLEGRTMLKVPSCDKEVEFGTLVSFAYKLVDPVIGHADEIVVATTRIETMLGDTGIAVHPDDLRYKHLHGAYVQHPFCLDRKLKIIPDEMVDPNFGTGAVKITPAHDKNDYEVGNRHGLEFINILDDNGCINDVCSEFSGLHRFEARQRILDGLKAMNLYRGTRDNPMTIPICSRSGDIIEPRLKDQWYVDCGKMSERALEAVYSGSLSIEPAHHKSVWHEFLSKSRDWCISRQLWWGHRIPAYHVTSKTGTTDLWVSGRNIEEATQKAVNETGKSPDELILQQDEDVLDTWFSSALFPFSVLGWPDTTTDLQYYYPTSLLETGSDILFFWVARMVMLGQELTGVLPFNKVLLHGMVRDAHGRKMSKSLGNVIDPMDVINGVTLQQLHDKLEFGNLDQNEIAIAKQGQQQDYPNGIPTCGADALRFTLCSYNFKNDSINMNVDHVRVGRNFCNKIWQAFRFYLRNAEDFQTNPEFQPHREMDKWILSRLSELVDMCDQHFRNYDLHLAAQAIQYFLHHELCDVYIEAVKPVLNSVWDDSESACQTLHRCLDTGLRCLHPFMPFVTEELYQHLRDDEKSESICIARYPKPEDYMGMRNIDLEDNVTLLREMVTKILSVKAQFQITRTNPKIYVQSDDEMSEKLVGLVPDLMTLSRSGLVEFKSAPTDLCFTVKVRDDVIVHVELYDIIDRDSQIQLYEAKLNKCSTKIEKCEKQLKKSKNGDSEQEKYGKKLEKLKGELLNLQDSLGQLKRMRKL